MKRQWENHELAEHWTIEQADHQLIRQKRGVNRVGFALLLKFFQLKGRFSGTTSYGKRRKNEDRKIKRMPEMKVFQGSKLS